MNKQEAYTALKAMTVAAVILSALCAAAICAAPQFLIARLKAEADPMIEMAIAHTQNEAPELALIEIEKTERLLAEAESLLMVFYDHGDVHELVYAARAAEELAKAADKTQLLTELTAIECGLEKLKCINEARLFNLF